MIAGVCGGIAEYLGWDPTILRIIFVVGTFITSGTLILFYFILALVMPD
jgi:phage shock protein PspC (stress-responsive transcriptional regulator)